MIQNKFLRYFINASGASKNVLKLKVTYSTVQPSYVSVRILTHFLIGDFSYIITEALITQLQPHSHSIKIETSHLNNAKTEEVLMPAPINAPVEQTL